MPPKPWIANSAAAGGRGLIGAGAFYLTEGNEQLVKMTARGGK